MRCALEPGSCFARDILGAPTLESAPPFPRVRIGVCLPAAICGLQKEKVRLCRRRRRLENAARPGVLCRLEPSYADSGGVSTTFGKVP